MAEKVLEFPDCLAAERFERAFEDAPLGMLMIRGGLIERVNAAAAALFGRDPAELVGCDPQVLAHSEETPATQAVQATMREGRTPPPQNCRIVRPDGRVLHTHLTFSQLHETDPMGGPLALVLIADRTAEVEADEARAAAMRLFSTAVDQAPIGMCLVGLDGRFLRVNAALCQLFGLSADQLLAGTFQELTHPDDLGADLALLRECLDGTREGYELPKRYLRPDGQLIHALLSVCLIRTPAGAPHHFVSQIVDVTQARAAQEQIRVMEERDRIAGELHDNSIQRLFAVGLTLQSLAGALPDPEHVRRLEAAVTHIDDTISGIRDVIYGLQGRGQDLST